MQPIAARSINSDRGSPFILTTEPATTHLAAEPVPPPPFLCCKDKNKAKHEISLAVKFLCPEFEPLYKSVLKRMIISVSKCSSCSKEHCGAAKPKEKHAGCTHKDECGADCGCGCKADTVKYQAGGDIRDLAKGIISRSKDEVKHMLDVVVAVIKRLRGHPTPQHGKMKKKIAKKLAKLLHKMHLKAQGHPEWWEPMAEKFLSKRIRKVGKKVKRRCKKLAELATFYFSKSSEDSGCSSLERTVETKCLTRAMTMLVMKTMHAHMKEMAMRKEDPTVRQPTPPCKTGCVKMKRRIEDCCLRFASRYMADIHDEIGICTPAVADVVKQTLKDCTKYGSDAKKDKLTGKIVALCMMCAAGEKKTGEYYADVARRYIKGCVACCPKECICCCRRYPKMAMRIAGVKDKCVLHVGKRMGAVMCCQKFGAEGCPKDKVAEFATKWTKEFAPAVEEAVKAAREMFKDEAAEHGEYMVMFKIRKMSLMYLQLFCQDGKFNKEDFRAHIEKMKGNVKRLFEKYGTHETCAKVCCGDKPMPEDNKH